RWARVLLPEGVGIEQLVVWVSRRIEAIEQPELGQFLDGMGQRIDADAELANSVRLLINLAVDAAGMQHERGRETTDAAADDDDLHRAPTTNATLAGIMIRKIGPAQRFSPDVVDAGGPRLSTCMGKRTRGKGRIGPRLDRQAVTPRCAARGYRAPIALCSRGGRPRPVPRASPT